MKKRKLILGAIAALLLGVGVWASNFVINPYLELPADFDLTNLIAHWKKEEASGTRVDSHSTHDMTDNNTVGQGTGKIGNAADLETNTNEYFSRSSTDTAFQKGDEDFTIVLWANPETVDVNERGLFSRWNWPTGDAEWMLRQAGTPSKFIFNISNGTTSGAIGWGTEANSTGTWYLVIAWNDSANDLIYIQVDNGTPASASHVGGASNQSQTTFIGKSRTGTSFEWDGLLDSVSFFDRVLTDQERTDLYASGSGNDYPFAGMPLFKHGRRVDEYYADMRSKFGNRMGHFLADVSITGDVLKYRGRKALQSLGNIGASYYDW